MIDIIAPVVTTLNGLPTTSFSAFCFVFVLFCFVSEVIFKIASQSTKVTGSC